MAPLSSVLRAAAHRKLLATQFPWTISPLIICAPMRVFTGPQLALAVSAAGGLGFIGPGLDPSASLKDLDEAASLLSSFSSNTDLKLASLSKYFSTSDTLPIGIGFQTWNGSLTHATDAVRAHRPAAAWLFAPRNGQTELDEWAAQLRAASPETKIWVQVGTLTEAREAAASASPPDVLVLQGAEAGGHGRSKDGVGVVALLPEVADALGGEHHPGTNLADIPLIAAGGLVDGRGVAAAFGLGAAGVAMGTRFLASREARIAEGYRNAVVNAEDGAATTTRTHLYNHLRGTFGWPEQWAPRALLNQSWRDHVSGDVEFEEIKKRHDDMMKQGHEKAYTPEEGRLAAYLGASVGLVRTVGAAGEIVDEVRNDTKEIMKAVTEGL